MTGENALPLRLASASNVEYSPAFPYPSEVHARIADACARLAVDAGLAPACLWDGSFSPWQDWERIRRINGDDLSAAERWAAEHPDSWRVHRLRTVNNFDVLSLLSLGSHGRVL